MVTARAFTVSVSSTASPLPLVNPNPRRFLLILTNESSTDTVRVGGAGQELTSSNGVRLGPGAALTIDNVDPKTGSRAAASAYQAIVSSGSTSATVSGVEVLE